MRATSASIRTIGLSATAVLALVALATAVPTGSLRAVIASQARATQGQPSAVRLVAAAVAAAARELARVDHQGCVDAAMPVDLVVMIAPQCGRARPHAMVDPGSSTLIEQLLDLPPPIC